MNLTVQRHTGWQSVGLHLIPGLLITIFFILAALVASKIGYPTLMALLLAILLILVPFELGILLWEGKKRNGSYSLQGVVFNREPLPAWQYFVIIPLLVGWCGLIYMGLSKMDAAIVRDYFAWVPVWLTFSISPDVMTQYSHSAVVTTVIAGFLLNGLAGPLVEELYFRGYLLPRIPASSKWAPLINMVLFSLYHFFSPWQNVTRILVFIPMVYAVAWKRNIYLSMVTHCTVNILGMLPLLSLLAA